MDIRICIDVDNLERAISRPLQDRRCGRMANLADPGGHGFDLLQFKGRGYDEMLPA